MNRLVLVPAVLTLTIATSQQASTQALPNAGAARYATYPGRLVGTGVQPLQASSPALISSRPVAEAPRVQGTLSGVVTDAATLRPLPGAQVFIRSLNLSVISNSEGTFQLSNVPDGRHVVEASMLGYSRSTEEVTIRANQQTVVNFALRPAAITLEGIVVTGAGVQEERRRLGFASSSVAAAEIETRPIQNVTDVLRGQIAGVMPSGGHGDPGAAAPIRIRGQRSLSQRNDPLIVIDGVRQDASMTNLGPLMTNRLDDINPQDIARIEVIKGAAAATLFGTEASSGVIQIFTKRGSQGPPQYSVTVNQGLSRYPRGNVPPITFYDPTTRSIQTVDPIGAMIGTGHLQDYSLSVSGGTPIVEYFVSGRFMDEEGALRPGGATNRSLRSRTNVRHGEKLRSELGLNVIRNEVRLPNTRPQDGPILPHVSSHPRNVSERLPYGEAFFTVREMLAPEMRSLVDRYSIDYSAVYNWTPTVTSRAVVGYNRVSDKFFQTVELGQGILANQTGMRDLQASERSMLTLDFNTAAEMQATEQVGVQLWAGGQAVMQKDEGTRTRVSDFPVPGLTTLSAGSRITNVSEDFQEVVNAGLFSQAQLDFRDRLYLTAGIRGDGNSAFGEDFGLSIYPKVSGSYVISDEPFWPGGTRWSLLRLRAAYGQSGLQPGAFDAVQTWVPRSRFGQSIVWAGNLGNPGLKPERSTEIEFGADIALLNDRLGIELTYFSQRTDDALVPVPRPASQGFSAPQLQNVGQTEAKGFEALVNLSVIQSRNFSWSMTATGATLNQKVNSLGGVNRYTIQTDRVQAVVAVGQAPGVLYVQVLDEKNPYRLDVPVDRLSTLRQIHANTLKNAAGQDSLVYSKSPLPTLSGTYSTEVGLPGGLQIQAVFNGAKGFQTFSAADLVWYQNMTHPDAASLDMELHDPNTSVARREEIALQHARRHPSIFGNWVLDGDYIRFQELSLRYQLPQSLTRGVGLDNISLSLAAQNLALWTKEWEGIAEPTTVESRRGGGRTIDITNQRFHNPDSQRLTLTLRAGW